MKTTRLTICAAAALFAFGTQAHAQDELDELRNSLATPTPAPARAATPKSSPTQAPAASRTSERRTPTRRDDAPVHSEKPDLAHGHFLVPGGDLDKLAGKQVPANTFLTGTYRYIGDREESGKRYRFQSAAMSSFFTAAPAPVLVLIRFPVRADNKLFTKGYLAKWEQNAPLQVERVEKGPSGTTVYATDVTP